MQFLKTLFWILVVGLAVAFAVNNWAPVPVRLWGGLIADVKLPFLLFLGFLLGYLPMLLIFHATRWRLRARISGLERTLADLRSATAPPPPEPEQLPSPPPPGALI